MIRHEGSRRGPEPRPGLPAKSINTWFYSAGHQLEPEGFTAPIKSARKRSISDGGLVLMFNSVVAVI